MRRTPSPGQQVCDDLVDDNGTPIQTDVRSYGGYDYMAKNLASHGYAVMSLEANTSNFDNGFTDGGARVRSLITQANLELLWRWNNGAGPYVPGEPDHTVGTKLVGKLNFAEGIGLDPVVHVGEGDRAVPSARNPITFSQTPVRYDRPPPRLDEHGDEIRRWLADPATRTTERDA
jgi:hypothetical protein